MRYRYEGQFIVIVVWTPAQCVVRFEACLETFNVRTCDLEPV